MVERYLTRPVIDPVHRYQSGSHNSKLYKKLHQRRIEKVGIVLHRMGGDILPCFDKVAVYGYIQEKPPCQPEAGGTDRKFNNGLTQPEQYGRMSACKKVPDAVQPVIPHAFQREVQCGFTQHQQCHHRKLEHHQ